ncbi:MAG: hypothetical protein HON65_13150 [Rhodospirillales bacterium]|jgi:hypothetical protein|nr:hypothetical protein [Rhodospirillales bacterium]
MNFNFSTSFLTLTLLTGCASASPEREACLKAYENFPLKQQAHEPSLSSIIGKQASQITNIADYEIIRILGPISMMTMDYRLERVNLYTNCDGIIIATTNG